MTDVVVEKKGHVAIVKIEHMKAMNALSTDMYAQLEEAFDEVGKMDDVYCVILTGSSTVNKKGKTVNSFVAGADIAQMSTMTVAEGKFFGNDSNRVCWKIENFKRPKIPSSPYSSYPCKITSVSVFVLNLYPFSNKSSLIS